MAVFYYWIICLSVAFSLGIAVDICSNGTETGRTVILQRDSNSNREDCRCSFQLIGESGTNIIFSSQHEPYGCQYRLVFDFRQNRSIEKYNCRDYNMSNKYLNPGYNYTVMLAKDTNNTGGFVFDLEISTEYINTGNLTIACSTTGNPISTVPVPNLASTTTVQNTEQIKTTTDTNGKQTPKDMEEENDSLAVIIGCSVSGVVLISIVITTVIVCFLKRRKEKTMKDQRLSEQNISGRPIYSGCYEDVSNLTTQNENKDTGHAVTFSHSIDNDLNNFDDYDHLPEPNHVPAQPNHVPIQPSHVSAQPNLVPIQLKDVPNTSDEYAVVDKRPKKGSSKSNVIELNNKSNNVKVNEDYENTQKDKLNLKREIDRIVGPKGDEYTLVNKC